MIENYTPLCDLTDEQQERLKQLLRNQPSHTSKPDHINLSRIAKYLTALEQMGKANLTDKQNLRLWVAQVTGKNVPSSSQFKEAIPAKPKEKVLKMKQEIEKLIQ